MERLDYMVLIGYFVVMAGIGVVSMLRVKNQEDFFMGGRSFGKILQAFAAFGAGTGSYDPVTVGRTTFTSGLSGIWSVLLWLFATPFYWITAVWYRRMRHLTLGDWFVERYQSKAMGLAYAVFGITLMMWYLGLGFSAIGKVCAPLLGTKTVELSWAWLPWQGTVGIEVVLVPVTALVVLIYGILGGLRAAYFTDLIQGIFIILLSILLIPAGLSALVDKHDDPQLTGIGDGFQIMHQQVPPEYFQITDTPQGGEFPLHYIVAIVLLNLTGVVVQPHFITVGGGSAKTEMSARVGLVTGNFMKRLCTVGWALTALILLACMADNVDIAEDPDQVWGVAARELLGPFRLGLVGLMLACLMAALMSSADCYMLIVSALVIRNGYAAYINPQAKERTYLLAGRLVGIVVIVGGVIVSLLWYDVLAQVKVIWEIPIIFAAPFWVGMFWRRATPAAAWTTVAFSLLAFFVIPAALPRMAPSLTNDPRFTATNDMLTTIVTRPAAPADVSRREAAIGLWHRKVRDWVKQEKASQSEAAAIEKFGPAPEPIRPGQRIEDEFTTGGKSIYWKGGAVPIGEERLKEIDRKHLGNTLTIRRQYDCPLQGQGSFNLDFFFYESAGLDLTALGSAELETLRVPSRVVLPFVVMILLSLVTRRAGKEGLDRFYVKMKTPVQGVLEDDRREIELSYDDPRRFDHRRLISRFGLEFQRPRPVDVIGFLVSFAICFAIIWLAVWLATLGS